MQVTTVRANIRYSKALGEGRHKTVELGAEGAVGQGETWEQAQQALYAALGAQLKALWGNGNGKPEEKAAASTPPTHYCQPHGVPFRRFEKEGRSWYAHKGPDGRWCREKS